MDGVFLYMLLVASVAVVSRATDRDDENACETGNSLTADVRLYQIPGGPLCDNNLAENWYKLRMNDGRLTRMPQVCIKNNHGGTQLPMRLDLSGRGLPAVNTTLEAHVCTSFNVLGAWDCCVLRQDAAVRNCGDFYVYYLKPVDRCPVAYVAQEPEQNPSGQYTAKTGDNHLGSVNESAVPQPTADVTTANLSSTTDVTSTNMTGSISSPSPTIASLPRNNCTGHPERCYDNRWCYGGGASIACRDGNGCGARCDGLPQCDDESDESADLHCSPPSCTESTLACPDGTMACYTRCDGRRDCNDGSDEAGCEPADERAASSTAGTTSAGATEPSPQLTDAVSSHATSSVHASSTTRLDSATSSTSTDTSSTTTQVPSIASQRSEYVTSQTTDQVSSTTAEALATTETTITVPEITATSPISTSVMEHPSISSTVSASTAETPTSTVTQSPRTTSSMADAGSSSQSTSTTNNLGTSTTISDSPSLSSSQLPDELFTPNRSVTTVAQHTEETDSVITPTPSTNVSITSQSVTRMHISSEQKTSRSSVTEPATPLVSEGSSSSVVSEVTSVAQRENTSIQITTSPEPSSIVSSKPTTHQISNTTSVPTTTIVAASSVSPVLTTVSTQPPTTAAASSSTLTENTRGSSVIYPSADSTDSTTSEPVSMHSSTSAVTSSTRNLTATSAVSSRHSSVTGVYVTPSTTITTPAPGTTSTISTARTPITTTISAAVETSKSSAPNITTTIFETTITSTSRTTTTVPTLLTTLASTQRITTTTPTSTSEATTTKRTSTTVSIPRTTTAMSMSNTPSSTTGSMTHTTARTPVTMRSTSWSLSTPPPTPVSTMQTPTTAPSEATATPIASVFSTASTSTSNSSNTTHYTVFVEDGDTEGLFGHNPGLFIFLIAASVVLFCTAVFGCVGLAYLRRRRTWSPEMSFQDAYAETEKSTPPLMREKHGVDSPIPDVDILRGEELDSPSKASTLVCGPTPDRLQTMDETSAFNGMADTSDHNGFQTTPTKPAAVYADLGTGQENGGFFGDDMADGDGVVPIDELDQISPRIMFPWIDSAEDTKL